MEELTRTEPEAAAEKLAELDKVRIEERASLKHRNTLKYLQDQAKRPKMTKNQRNYSQRVLYPVVLEEFVFDLVDAMDHGERQVSLSYY